MANMSLLEFINKNDYCIVFVIDSNHFSSKLFEERLSKIQIGVQYLLVELSEVKYFAEYFNLVIVPTTLFFKSGNLIGKLQGLVNSDNLCAYIEFYRKIEE